MRSIPEIRLITAFRRLERSAIWDEIPCGHTGFQTFDPSLSKAWAVRDRTRVQSRKSSTAFNHANLRMGRTLLFDGKNNVIPTAGLIAPPTLSDSREIKFGLRLNS